MKAGHEKFLILGSNSFSGSYFCKHLAGLGYDVLATSRSVEPHIAFLPYKWSKQEGSVRFFQIDINSDLERLSEILKIERPTHIVNFAAQSMVGESWINPDHWMMTNVVSTVRLHEVLRKYEALERYIHVTTPEVYGSTDGWIKESNVFNPSTPYAVSRAAGDMSLNTYFQNYNFPVVFTRAANVYGPGQQLYRLIPRTIYAALTGKKLRLDGGGKSTRVFIHMEDVSEATFRVARSGTLGDTYHISGHHQVSIRSCVELIVQTLEKDFDECVEFAPERLGKDAAYLLDSSKIRDQLGWADRVTLKDGIADTLKWLRNFEEYLPLLKSSYEHKP